MQKHLPAGNVISLDALRAELGVALFRPTGGGIEPGAQDVAREFLRAKKSFVWNATNLSRHVRTECVRLFHEHGARVRIVYVEAPGSAVRPESRPEKEGAGSRHRKGFSTAGKFPIKPRPIRSIMWWGKS